ncbi:MAG: cyclopropane fatty acyl phospholipid synthase [Anaerolineales bacterium]|nr:MAG: cyclopropane fatty acyl phospholipid synthase [Anaerolineales bacterium]
MRSETILRELFESAGIEINGKHAWDIHVHNDDFYDRVLKETSLGLGEAYMDGWWDCEAIDEFITRVLLARLDEKVKGDWRILAHALRVRLLNMQRPSKAFEVGEQHYDLGNDLYRAMLDKRLNYTCAYWKNAKTLDKAQEAKLELVCKKINLKAGMRVLELGCGWGSFAKYAAEKYGAHVLGVTVSKEQAALGMELCRGLPVELRLQDYREVQGTYDAVISIGIMEHVGPKNYRIYMETVKRCLKEGGIGFIHTIGRNFSSTTNNPWTDKYIFPNGVLPSISQISAAMEPDFVVEDLHNFGPYYDTTLMAWEANFRKAWPRLKEKYSGRFYRMWRYYLLSSVGGFRTRSTQLWQIVMTRQGTPQPTSRFS